MAFYDHFINADTASISYIGKKTIEWENKYFIRLIRKFSKNNNPSLLEIGPGKGFFAHLCKKNGFEYTAIEVNKLMSDKLSKMGLKVFNAYVPPIKLKDKFDVIFMNQVFEHMKNRDEAREMVKSCKEHLNEDGLIIISSPDILSVKQDFYQDYTHDYPTSLMRLSKLLADYDLKVLYKDYYTFFTTGYIKTRIIAFLTRLCYNLGIFKIFFGKKAYKVKISLLPALIIIGKK